MAQFEHSRSLNAHLFEENYCSINNNCVPYLLPFLKNNFSQNYGSEISYNVQHIQKQHPYCFINFKFTPVHLDKTEWQPTLTRGQVKV